MKFFPLVFQYIGGVLLAISNSIPSRLVECPDSLELVLVNVGMSNPIWICLLYNPPNASSDYRQNLYLEYLCSDHTPLVIMGDFNVPDVNWATLSGSTIFSSQLCDLVFQFNLL